MFPGRPSAPNICVLSKASANLVNRLVRPSSPAIGFDSVTCNPFLMLFSVKPFSPSESTWKGWVLLLLNIPDLNISKLAIASPSDLRYTRWFSLLLYVHELPAPASSKTDMRNKSSSRLVRSDGSTSLPQLARRLAIRSLPPTLKCCHLP